MKKRFQSCYALARISTPMLAALIGAALATLAVNVQARPAQAQPSTDQVLTNMGLSSDDIQRVLNGEFVQTSDVTNVSDRDLSMSIAFLVKMLPDSLAKQVVAGKLVKDDPQVQLEGEFKGRQPRRSGSVGRSPPMKRRSCRMPRQVRR